MPAPLTYHSAVEQPKPDELDAIASINATMHGILETTWQDYGHSVRSVHAKSHGLLQGQLRVLDDLPAELAQGVFARAATYPVVLRISTNPGDILDDTVSSPRGLAMKIIGVEGERLEGSENEVTQDFIMVNGPAFVAPDARGFSHALKLLAVTTDTGQGWKKALSAVLRGVVSAASELGLDGSALKALGGHPLTHPLGETFFTQTPFRYGDYVAKLSVAPVSAKLTGLKDAPVQLAGRPNGLRAAVIDFFSVNGGEWELRVQLRTNPNSMPIEDASVAWPEDESPYRTVARLTVARQPAWNEARAEQVDDGLAFSPWHGVLAHRPLGSINRARKDAYALSAGFRSAHNRCPVHEPHHAVDLSGAAPSVFGKTSGREGRRPHTPDARPGALGQPLNAVARKVASGAIGGLAAGTLLSAVFLGMEGVTGGPFDFAKLRRRAKAGWLVKRQRGVPKFEKQLVLHGGHLALATAAGAVYGVAKPDGVSPLIAGTGFGAGFYVLAYGVLGSMLRTSPKLPKDTPARIIQQSVFHVLFGVTAAIVAERAARRL